MPAIRDISAAFETVTTDGGLTLPCPANVVGDWLIVGIQSDTGTPTYTLPDGSWTQITQRVNTCSMTLFKRKITVVLTGNLVFGASVTETYNGWCISVSDCDGTDCVDVFTTATQAAAAKVTLPTITTTGADRLILTGFANSGVGVPSVLEGPATSLVAQDGSAESQGVGWTMQRTAGATPSNIVCSNVATGAGAVWTLALKPPSGGATEVPTYCAGDTSVYLDPINGVSAYNSNTALAATADTNFGTTINGKTLADATVAAAADVGLNSFHSAGRLTTPTGVANFGGAELVFATANRPNLTDKNLLVHLGPSTEGQLQRFASVASGYGFYVGLRSAAGSNFKFWQVRGVENGDERHAPVVVNPSAANAKHTNGTLNAAAVFAVGFALNSLGITTVAFDVTSMWAMGVTTIAGGNAALPVDAAGIVRAAGIGKERKSVKLQGKNQLLVLQELQFGDGGTNQVNVRLSGVAMEFPSLYNAVTKQVAYNSIPNKCGVIFNGGASDVFDLRGAVMASPSPYKVEFATGCQGALYTDGWVVNGAGYVTLRNITSPSQQYIGGVTFTDCGPVTQNGAYVQNCSFQTENTPSGDGIAALHADNPGRVSDCTFTATAQGGHGIKITTPGTYTFAGNVFNGFGVDGSDDAAVFNDSGGAVTLNVTGGGSAPTVTNGAGASTTINANVTVTLTGLQNPSEVRVFNAGTQTERSGTGAENVTSGSHAFAIPSGTAVDIVILSLGYQNMRILAYSTFTDAAVPVSQIIDRQYAN